MGLTCRGTEAVLRPDHPPKIAREYTSPQRRRRTQSRRFTPNDTATGGGLSLHLSRAQRYSARLIRKPVSDWHVDISYPHVPDPDRALSGGANGNAPWMLQLEVEFGLSFVRSASWHRSA